MQGGLFAGLNLLSYKPLSNCTEYELKVAGNDPDMTDLPTHMAQDKIMLVGTSGLRMIGIACALGAECPKLFLIDNSRRVIQFWNNLKREIENASSHHGIMEKVKPEVCECEACERIADDKRGYLAFLANNYGFSRIKRMILNTSVIPQNWADARTFEIIGNLAMRQHYEKVYVYASNIVACVAHTSPSQARNILSNIRRLNPDLAIHTDWARKKMPEKVFYYTQGRHQVDAVYAEVTASLSSKTWPEVCPLAFNVRRGVVTEENTARTLVSDEKPDLSQGNMP